MEQDIKGSEEHAEERAPHARARTPKALRALLGKNRPTHARAANPRPCSQMIQRQIEDRHWLDELLAPPGFVRHVLRSADSICLGLSEVTERRRRSSVRDLAAASGRVE